MLRSKKALFDIHVYLPQCVAASVPLCMRRVFRTEVRTYYYDAYVSFTTNTKPLGVARRGAYTRGRPSR